MEQDNSNPLESRMGELESEVRDLRKKLSAVDQELAILQSQVHVQSQPDPSRARTSRPSPIPPAKETFKPYIPELDDPPKDVPPRTRTSSPNTSASESGASVDAGETWLSRIGIFLLLLGVVFLVKYSIDRGWITPAVRLVMGFTVGVVLVQLGFRNRGSREVFSQILQGGGIAAFYIVGFAAYQLYGLMPHPVAYGYMVAVTVTTVVLSLRQEFESLSTVAILGGLATPFLLHSGSNNIPGLVGYTCFLLAGALWIFYYKGWQSVFITAFVGGWLVHYIAVDALPHSPRQALNSYLTVQAGLILSWLAFWWVAVLQILNDEWRLPASANEEAALPFEWTQPCFHLSMAFLGSAMVAFFFSTEMWHLKEQTWGLILLGGATLYALAAWKLHVRDVTLGWLNALVSLTLGALSLACLFRGNTLIFSLALEMAAMHAFAHRLNTRFLHNIAHCLFAFVTLWLAGRLFLKGVDLPRVFNLQALTDLAIFGLMIVSAFRLPEEKGRPVYLLATYLGLLCWWNRELISLANGNGLVSIAWGLQGASLFIIGLRRNAPQVFKAGFVTLVLVALKLLLVDLEDLDTLWRILLFLGIGAGFLGLSYKVRDLEKGMEH